MPAMSIFACHFVLSVCPKRQPCLPPCRSCATPRMPTPAAHRTANQRKKKKKHGERKENKRSTQNANANARAGARVRARYARRCCVYATNQTSKRYNGRQNEVGRYGTSEEEEERTPRTAASQRVSRTCPSSRTKVRQQQTSAALLLYAAAAERV